MKPHIAEKTESIIMDLRLMDPLSVLDEHFDDSDHVTWLEDDMAALDRMVHEDGTLSVAEKQSLMAVGSELRLDWLYAKQGGGLLPHAELSDKIDEVEDYLDVSVSLARELKEADPRPFWDATSRLLDVQAFRSYTNAHEAATHLAGTPAGKYLHELARAQLRGVILTSTQLMADLHNSAHDAAAPYGIRRKAAGTNYEVMLTAFERLKLYRQDAFGETFVRSSLLREDNPKEAEPGPKSAFDIVKQGIHATVLIQAKSGKVVNEYREPVQVIHAPDGTHLLENAANYIEAFKQVITTPKTPEQQQVPVHAYEYLAEYFESGEGSDQTQESAA